MEQIDLKTIYLIIPLASENLYLLQKKKCKWKPIWSNLFISPADNDKNRKFKFKIQCNSHVLIYGSHVHIVTIVNKYYALVLLSTDIWDFYLVIQFKFTHKKFKYFKNI